MRLSLLIILLMSLLSACRVLLAQDDFPANEAGATVSESSQTDTDSGPAQGTAAGSEASANAPAESSESAIPSTPLEIAWAMGTPFTAAFAIASVIAMWSAIERLLMLRKRRVIPRAFVDRFLMHLRMGRMEKPEAVTICQQNLSPIADVFLHGVRKWGKPSVEIEQAVIDGGERQVGLLKKRLRVLNGVATITPLIGLQGTVVGMIMSFNDIATAGAMGQTQQLARGIGMALLTTAVGLFIAIPALTIYMFLAGKVDALVMEMDRLGQELVHLISAEALRDRAVAGAETPAPARKSSATSSASTVPRA